MSLGGIEQPQRVGGALDCRLADFVGVGERSGLATDPAKAEARRGMIVGGFQPTVIEAECLARRILQEQLAVVVRRKMFGREPAGIYRIEVAAVATTEGGSEAVKT